MLELKIYGCTKADYIMPIIDLIEKAEGRNIRIEHLIVLNESDNMANIQALRSILPLLKYDFYKVFYKDGDYGAGKPTLFDDFFIINITGVRKYFCFTSLDGNQYGSCLVSEEKGAIQFLLKAFKNIKENEGFSNAFVRESSLDYMADTIYELSRSGKFFLIKPNPCYHRIPETVLRSVASRMTDEQKQELISQLGDKLDLNYGIENAVEYLIENLTGSNEMSKTFLNIDVFTKDGLMSFVKTGRISDHYSFFPAFDKIEIRDTLLTLINKVKDPNDNYKVFISNLSLKNNISYMGISEKVGIWFDYCPSYRSQTESFNTLIKHDLLTGSFLDFCENYIEKNIAMSREDGLKYLEYLIEATNNNNNHNNHNNH
jgi:hypothetical protein